MDEEMLSPDLDRFASEAVAAGRYRDLAHVVQSGLSLVQRQEQARADLLVMVSAARDEGDRDGYLTGDQVAQQVRATIARRNASPA